VVVHGVRPPLARFHDSIDRTASDIQAGLQEPSSPPLMIKEKTFVPIEPPV
jgi:hypothetical protein